MQTYLKIPGVDLSTVQMMQSLAGAAKDLKLDLKPWKSHCEVLSREAMNSHLTVCGEGINWERGIGKPVRELVQKEGKNGLE